MCTAAKIGHIPEPIRPCGQFFRRQRKCESILCVTQSQSPGPDGAFGIGQRHKLAGRAGKSCRGQKPPLLVPGQPGARIPGRDGMKRNGGGSA